MDNYMTGTRGYQNSKMNAWILYFSMISLISRDFSDFMKFH